MRYLNGILFAIGLISLQEPIFAADYTESTLTTSQYSTSNTTSEDNPPPVNNSALNADAKNLMANYLPIQTPGLTPGDVTPQAMNNPHLIQPIFLIGSDERSKNWLSQNLAALKKMQAIGILVQADNVEAVKTIQQIGQGVSIIPAAANQLVKQYSLTHYPVLITKAGITQ